MPEMNVVVVGHNSPADMSRAVAPFTPSEVAALIARQGDDTRHGYTCPQCSKEPRNLQPTHKGLSCIHCGYLQSWVHRADVLPPPGILFSRAELVNTGVYLAECITPFQLLSYLESITFWSVQDIRLIFPRSMAGSRALPWFARNTGAPVGYRDTNLPEGVTYVFRKDAVKVYIKNHWTPELEEADKKQAARALDIRAAFFDLSVEKERFTASLMAGGRRPGAIDEVLGSYLGTNRRLVAEIRRRLMHTADQPAGIPLDTRFLTPALLREAIESIPAAELPPYVKFESLAFGDLNKATFYRDNEGVFPWQVKDIPGEFARYTRGGEAWYRLDSIIDFLNRDDLNRVEYDARLSLNLQLATPEGERYLYSAVSWQHISQ